MAEEAERFLRTAKGDQQAEATFDSKKWLWVPDEEQGYIKATVKENAGEQIVVEIQNGGSATFDADKCYQMNPPKFEKIEDMASLTYLSDATVLENLRQRYYSSLIYTYSGLFCVVINPYRRLPIYTDAVVNMYKGKRRNEMPPHVFSVTDNAYCDMLQNHENQSILITGESGAGKTENTKKVIQYLANVAGSGAKKGHSSLDQQVIEANPVLEAFGNAKTTRNDNSSRFGKFIRIRFGNTGKISGADIEYYLLEKSRVVRQTEKERAYHIFYQLLSGADDEVLKSLLLTRNYSDYHFIQNSCGTVDSMDDVQEFKSVEDGFNVLGIEKDEKMSLFRVVAAILHLGNIKLRAKNSRDDQAEVADPSDAQKAAHLLGIKVDELCKSLVRPRIKVGNEWVAQGRTSDQVTFSIAAISMALYERMFKWLVTRINKTLDYKLPNQYFVGVLDIAGFEIFDLNSFEQLCINYTNEKLQQFFNHHMFVLEQELYRKEGVEWEFIDFGLDLQGTIELIEKPLGILSLLDEECLFPKASDQTFTDKLHQKHEGKSQQYSKIGFTKGNKIPAHFKIHHYAGSVPYNTDKWLDKNRDPLNDNVVELLKKSQETFMHDIWGDRAAESTTRKKGSQFQTVSQIHKNSLNKLMTTLQQTQPHFVRCIIPNESKKPGKVDAKLVLHQLHCNGVLEGIRICRKGFPNRLPFQEFRQRYAILAPKSAPVGFMDGRKAAESLLVALQLEKSEFRVGMTKVFFRAGVLGMLENDRDNKLSTIITSFQALVRGRLMRAMYHKLVDQRLAIAVIQRNMRKHVFLRNWPWWKLYNKVKPLLNVSRQEDEVRQKDEEITTLKDKVSRLEQTEKELEGRQATLTEEKQQLFNGLQREQDLSADAEDRATQLSAAKNNLEQQVAELMERLEEEQDANASISSAKRKLEAELEQRIVELDEVKRNLDKITSERASFEKEAKSLAEDLAKQTENVNRLTKNKASLETDLEETTTTLSTEQEKCSRLSKTKNRLEAQVKELLSDSTDQRTDLQSKQERLHSQLTQVQSELTDGELKIAQLTKKVQTLEEQLEDAKSLIDDTNAAKSDAVNKLKTALKDIASANEALEEEQRVKMEVQAKLQKTTSEFNALKQRMEAEVQKVEELEADKRRLTARCTDMDGTVTDLQSKLTGLERTKARYASEIEDLSVNLEKAVTASANLDKKQKKIDQSIAEWKARCESLTAELENAQREARTYSTEVLKLKNDLEEQVESLENARRENKTLAGDAKALSEQLGEGGKSTHELEKAKKRLEAERDELTEQLEETEGALEQEEGKVLRLQLETQQLKQDFERRLQECGDETDSVRKNCQRQMDSLQESLEAESRAKAEQARQKKKIEAEFTELQNAMEGSAKTNMDASKNVKRLQGQLKDMQAALEQEQKYREEAQAALTRTEHKANEIQSQVDEQRSSCETLERNMRNMENEMHDSQERASDLQGQMTSLSAAKRRAEQEATSLREEIEEISSESKMNEERARRFQNELGRMSTDHSSINETVNFLEKSKIAAERQVKELQANIEDLEAVGGKKLRQQITKLESKVREMEMDCEGETKKNSELTKANRRTERKLKELTFQVQEELENNRRLNEQVNQHQTRDKQLRRRAEEAEEETESLRGRIRRLQNEADEATGRADEAEASLARRQHHAASRGYGGGSDE